MAYSESKDLITWTQPQTILFPDESDASKEGYMLTKPLLIPGGKLHLNAETEPGGFIRIAVRRGDGVKDGDWLDGGNFDDGERFTGDSVDKVMQWKSGTGFDALKDKSLRLHFWLNKAKLYSFWFE